MLARDFLSLQGLEVVGAADLAEGLRLCARLRPSLVLLDLTLPGVTPEDAVARMTATGVPVVLMSGRADDEVARLQARARGFLPKPFTLAALAAAVGAELVGAPARVPAGAAHA
jgi:DNA-binding response OmpR family regulator